MKLEFGLTQGLFNSQFAPLAAIAHYCKPLLQPLDLVQLDMKSVKYTPQDKLMQVFVSILGGCRHLAEINTRLVPDLALAQAWGWERFADQSVLSRTLDELTESNICQLRQASTMIWRLNSRTQVHDWRGFLWLDFDLSGLPCSKNSEKAKKGYFSGRKNLRGRQLARVSATQYCETLWSELYAGNRHTITCLEPAVLATESLLELTKAQRERIIWRLDGGSGSDQKVRWLLARDYQLVAKGYSNVRAHKWAKQVRRWDPYGDAWLGEICSPIDWGRDARV